MTGQTVHTKDLVPVLLPAALLVLAIGMVAVQLAPDLPPLLDPGHTAPPETVTLPPGTLEFRPEGHFLRNNTPVDGPRAAVDFTAPFDIMRYQVSVEDY